MGDHIRPTFEKLIDALPNCALHCASNLDNTVSEWYLTEWYSEWSSGIQKTIDKNAEDTINFKLIEPYYYKHILQDISNCFSYIYQIPGTYNFVILLTRH